VILISSRDLDKPLFFQLLDGRSNRRTANTALILPVKVLEGFGDLDARPEQRGVSP
jgi:hypothetical protein